MSALPQEHWRLRPMDPSDVLRILEIERRAYPFPWTEGIFRDCLRVGYSSWIAYDDFGNTVAYALMSMAAGEAHILNLCVAPERQRRGLAHFMMSHLLAVARAAGARLVLLEVRQSNLPAQKLYETLGFQRLGVRRNYYPALNEREDAFVLGLDLE